MSPIFKIVRREAQSEKRIFFIIKILFALGVFFYCLAIALIDYFEATLKEKAAQLASADIIFHSHKRISLEQAYLIPQITETSLSEELMTMLYFPNGESKLVKLKTFEDNYPLRGKIALHQKEHFDLFLPKELFQEHKLHTHVKARLGEALFAVSFYETLRESPLLDAAMAPTVLLKREKLKLTGLVQPGSRVRYHLYVKSEAKKKTLESLKEKHYLNLLEKGVHLELAEERLDFLRRSISRAKNLFLFLSLSVLLLSLLGLALGFNILLRQRKRNTAILKTLGLPNREILLLYVSLLLYILLPSLGLGLFAANLFFPLFQNYLSQKFFFISQKLEIISLAQNLRFFATFFFGALFVSIIPLREIVKQSPLGIFRENERGAHPWVSFYYFLFFSILIFALALMQSGDVTTALRLYAITALPFPLFILSAPLLVWLARKVLPFIKNAYLHLILKNLTVLNTQSRLILAGSAHAVFLLATVSIGEYSLRREFHHIESEKIPNIFVLDIQPSQKELFYKLLEKIPVEELSLVPLISCRIVSINEKSILPEKVQVGREKSWEDQLRTREYLINYRSFLQANEEVIEGRFWPRDFKGHLVAVEEQWAKTFDVKLKDRIQLDIAGLRYEAEVSAIRRVRWEEMRPNAFFIFSPNETLESAPQTLLSSFYLKDKKEIAKWRRLVATRKLNWTIYEVSKTIEAVKKISEQISLAIWLASFVVMCYGFLLLSLTLAAQKESRRKDASLLKILGANKKPLMAYLIFSHSAEALLALTQGLLLSWLFLSLVYYHLFGLLPHLPIYLAGLVPFVLLISLAQAFRQSQEILQEEAYVLLRQTRV